MTKKKKVRPAEEPVKLEPSELEEARACLRRLNGDISYSNAKHRFETAFGWPRSKSNAAVVALHEEGFMKGDKNFFCHPDAEETKGIVKGARDPDRFTIMAENDPETVFPVPEQLACLPGDTFRLRRAVTGWRIAGFAERRQTKWVCRALMQGNRVQMYEGEIGVMPLSPFAPIGMLMEAKGVPDSVDLEHDAFEVEILPESLRPMPYVDIRVRFVRRVGSRFDPLGEIAIASAQYDIPVEFSPAAMKEAEALPDAPDAKSMAHRVDLRDVPLVTIDGEDSRDFDDAVWCTQLKDGRWRLIVAIADVSYYVQPGSALDADAQQRATSVYFPSSVVPMLPEKLSNGLCSLNPGVDRLAMVCDAVVGEDGLTQAYQFYPAVMRSHARLTYTQVWSALCGEADGIAAVGERLGDIESLYALYKVLRRVRKARHTMDFESTETQAVFDEQGLISDFKAKPLTDANRIIEECMLVANVCAAKFAIMKKRDTLFRIHDKPEESRIAQLRTILANFGERLDEPTAEGFSALIERVKGNDFLQTAILRTMPRACYSPDNIGHFGLQFDAYAHFTSPIRRYPDLLMHRTIRGILTRRVYVPQIAFDDSAAMESFHAQALSAAAKAAGPAEKKKAAPSAAERRREIWRRLGIICSAAERRADDATRDVMNYLKCDFMLKHGAGRHPAVVTGMIPAGVFVELEDMAVEGFVHVSNLGWGYWEFDEHALTMTSTEEMAQIHIGDRVTVQLDTVDLDGRRISFVICEREHRTLQRRRGRGRSKSRS
jgi:ribonuclease R